MWPGSQFLWILVPKPQGPEETQKTPERSGDPQKGLVGTLPERRQHGPESLSSVPGLSGSVTLLSMSFSSCSYYKETWSPNMDRRQLCVFWQDTSSPGLMFPIYKTKDLDSMFCLPWECSGSLDCLYLYVIVPRDSASCSMCRGLIHAIVIRQRAPPH